MYFYSFATISLWKRLWPFVWPILNPPYPPKIVYLRTRIATITSWCCVMLGWNCPIYSVRFFICRQFFFSLKRIWLSIRIEFNLHRIRMPLKNPQIWKLNWKYGQFCFQWQPYGWRTSSVNKVGRLPDFLESWTKLDENSSFGHRDSNSFKRTMPLHKWEMSLQLCFRLEYFAYSRRRSWIYVINFPDEQSAILNAD